MTETWRELEIRDDDERTPRRLRMPDPRISNLLLLAGGSAMFATYLLAATEPISLAFFCGVLCLGALLVVLGAVVKLDDRRTVRQIEHQRVLERQHRHIDDEVGLRNTHLAAMVEQSNGLMRQLMSAVEQLGKRIDAIDLKEMRERLVDLEADLASFRLWQRQMEPALAANSNGTRVLRALPRQSD